MLISSVGKKLKSVGDKKYKSKYKRDGKHERPTEKPELGTPNQRTIDSSIRSLRYMRQSFIAYKRDLKLDYIIELPSRIERAFKIIEKYSDKISIAELATDEIMSIAR